MSESRATKTKRAATSPNRPGEACQAPAGTWRPVVNRSKCEGKRDCVDVCPHDVFRVERMADADFAALGWVAKLKAIAHKRMTAYTPNADACRACGLCVVACPERAVSLIRV